MITIMKLISCHIENFGKLSDFSVDFEDRLTVFCRENGWGKSTLAAFLRVMFFGFEGETKRKGMENERKRYAPWQGGVYGGQIMFETGGKRYLLSRVFTDKKQNDVFELRDAETNLVSTDFSDNLGEEIFRINSEAFRRSVFIGQNDCVTHATDSINAKMGNLTDGRNDLDCYEQASAILTDELNRLNPRRKTGEIFRRREALTALETEVQSGETLADSIAQCETLLSAERASLEKKRGERERLAGLAAQVSRRQDQKARQTVYARMLEECREKRNAYDSARAAFPEAVPEEEKLQSCLEACDAMEQARRMLQTYQADKTEPAASGATEEAVRPQRKKTSPIPCLFGVVFLVLGVVLAYLGVGTAKFFVVLGVIFFAVGLQLLAIFAVKSALGGKADAALAQREKEQQDRAERERQNNHDLWQQKYDVERQFVMGVFDEMGIPPAEDLKKQLQDIWKRRILLAQAERDWQSAERKRQEFAGQNYMTGQEALPETELSSNASGELLPDLESLNRQMASLDAEGMAAQNRIRTYEQQLSGLREKYDNWTEEKERLERTRAELSDLKREYRFKQKAQQYLTQAKETLTARYMEPLMRSFSHYYQLILKQDALQYRMDANANLAAEEQGLLRETVCLSTGYQDLLGLCMRLAFVEAMYQDGKPFLILDDPFVNLDDEKLAGARMLLKDVAERYQIIYFTCSEGRTG